MSNATFQSATSVRQFLGLGVPGDVFDSGPFRAISYTLNSADAANNIFGRAFSLYLPGGDLVACAGNPTDTYPYAGILVGSKNYASLGDGVQPLNPDFNLPNGETGQLCTQGQIIVSLANTATPGQIIIFSNTTGALYSMDPSDPLPVDRSPAYARVVRWTIAGSPNVGVIELDPTIVYQPRA